MIDKSISIGSLTKNSREHVRVALDHFKGHDLLDIRITTESGGIWMPTAKGVSVNIAKLPELIALLRAAETKALELGMLEREVE